MTTAQLNHITNYIVAEEDYDEDKFPVERRFDEFGNEIYNFPENAAEWTGEHLRSVASRASVTAWRIDGTMRSTRSRTFRQMRQGGEEG